MLSIPKDYESSLCEIKSADNVLLAVGYIKEIGEDYIRIGEKNNVLQLITLNTPIKVNIFNNKLGFRVIFGYVFTSTPQMMKITDISELIDHERRNFFRVELHIPAKAYFKNMTEQDESLKYQLDTYNVNPEKIDISIKDMSLSGMRIQTKYDFNPGDEIWVEFVLNAKVCCCQCKIVRLVGVSAKNVNEFGCEFIFNEYDDRDVICSFLFKIQREQLRKKMT